MPNQDARRILRELRLLHQTVGIRVRRLPDFVRRRHTDGVAGIVEGGAIPIDEQDAVADDGCGLHFPRESPYPPFPRAGLRVIGRHQERARQENLVRAVRRAPEDRRRVPALRLRTHRLPFLLSGALVDREEIRPGALIAGEHDQVADDDRRGAHAVDVVERPERHLPSLLAARVVRHHAVVRKEDVDAVGLDGWAGRRRVVALVDDLRLHASAPRAPRGSCPRADRSPSSAARRRGKPSGRSDRRAGSATSVPTAAAAATEDFSSG